MHRLIFGCGYLGLRVAQRWQAAGDRVTVVSRRGSLATDVAKYSTHQLQADVTDPGSLTAISKLPRIDTVLFAVGYDRTTEKSIHEVYAQGLENVLSALPAEVGRVLYISTTGVYGPAGGGEVDEQTPPNPQREGGKASLAAEEVLRSSRFASRGVSLRLAGIYGPDRIPFLNQLKAGQPIAAPQIGHLNLIHVEDAAAIVVDIAELADPPPILCVSDNSPPLRGDYYREVARLIAAPEPNFADPPVGSPRAARAAADKQVRSNLIKQLGVALSYPNYRAGLAAILGNESTGG